MSAAEMTVAEPVTQDGRVAGYKITGNKQWISNGGYADLYSVLAKAPGGPSWFVVEKGVPGLSHGKPEDKHGIRASNTATVSLEGVYVDADRLLGGVEGQGLIQAQLVFGYTRLMVAAFGLGAGWAALDRAIPLALELRHALDDVRRSGRIADTPAGHRVRLRSCIERDGLAHRNDAFCAPGARFINGEVVEISVTAGFAIRIVVEEREADALEGCELIRHGEGVAQRRKLFPIGAPTENGFFGVEGAGDTEPDEGGFRRRFGGLAIGLVDSPEDHALSGFDEADPSVGRIQQCQQGGSCIAQHKIGLKNVVLEAELLQFNAVQIQGRYVALFETHPIEIDHAFRLLQDRARYLEVGLCQNYP